MICGVCVSCQPMETGFKVSQGAMFSMKLLLRIHPQHESHHFVVIELANALGVAGFAAGLRIDFVIHISRESREAKSAVAAGDVAFYGASAGVSDIHDRVGNRVILMVKHFASEQT